MLIIGYPKSGNTWFGYLMSYCLNAPYDNLMEPGVHPRNPEMKKILSGGLPHRSFDKVQGVWCTHEHKMLEEFMGKDLTVHIVRDGRDVVVSYFYYLNRFLVEERTREDGMTLKSKMKKVWAGFIEPWKFSSFVEPRSREWKDHVIRFRAAMPTETVRYEDLARDTEGTLRSLFKNLGLDVEDAIIRDAVNRFSFKAMAGREKGNEIKANFFRKGIVGDWMNKFNERDKRKFKEVAGDLLIELGYEKDLDW